MIRFPVRTVFLGQAASLCNDLDSCSTVAPIDKNLLTVLRAQPDPLPNMGTGATPWLSKRTTIESSKPTQLFTSHNASTVTDYTLSNPRTSTPSSPTGPRRTGASSSAGHTDNSTG